MSNSLKPFLVLLILIVASLSISAQNEVITNQDIIDLTNAGLAPTNIVEKINSTKTKFDLSTKALIELKKIGVAEPVISAMLKANQKEKEETTTIQPAINTPQTSTTSTTIDTPAPTNTADNTCLETTLNKLNTSQYIKNICDIAKKATVNPVAELNLDNIYTPLTELLVSEVSKRNNLFTDEDKAEAAKTFFFELDKKRIDKQIGSNSDSSGTTSLAIKGGAPSVIGWAVENGAATSSITGNTVTIRVNPVGLIRAFNNEGFLGKDFVSNVLKPTNKNQTFDKILRNFSTSFSFDTARGTETPTFIVSKQQLSAVSLRYEFINQRTPQSRRTQQLFNDFVNKNISTFTNVQKTYDKLVDDSSKFRNTILQNWFDETNAELKAIKSPTKELVRVVLEKRIALLPVNEIIKDSEVLKAFRDFANLTLDYVDKQKALIEEINKGTIVTFEYTNNREPIAPDTSNFRFIWEKGIFNKTSFTFNASLTTYNKKPVTTDVKRIRDFQFALQTETPLGNTFGTGDTTLTFAGKYERLNSDVVSDLGLVTPNSKGDIAIGQIKFTIPISDWGIKLPLSITFANRTDLIKESVVRANFGLTFDLDPLFARFKPF